MFPIIKTWVEISLLSGKPQDLPASKALLALIAMVEVAASFSVDTAHPHPGVRLAAALTQSAFLAGTVWAALSWRRHPERWLQTLTALYGSGVIVTLVAWAALRGLNVSQDAQSGPFILVAWVITLWALAIMSRVLRTALEVPLGTAILITIAYGIIGGLLMIAFPMS